MENQLGELIFMLCGMFAGLGLTGDEKEDLLENRQ